MPRRSFLLPLLAVIVGVAFVWILVRLLLVRYERGDVYPPYSTMRADPLGTRVFYESVALTGRHQVSRAFTSLHQELKKNPNALFYIGLESEQIDQFSKDEIASLDNYVRNGGRVIITLTPEQPGSYEPSTSSDKDEKKKSESDKTAPDPAPAEDEKGTQQEKYERHLERELQKADEKAHPGKAKEPKLEYQRSLAALWGFGVERHDDKKKKDADKGKEKPSEDDKGNDDVLDDVQAYSTLYGTVEDKTPWKSALYFVRLEPEWKTLFYAKFKPVMIRRPLGKGDVLIATDSYFLSNEALRDARKPMLLNYLAGWPGTLLFDETHLGTQHEEGVVSLMEKFRLEGFIIGLCVVMLLFLWRNSLPLVPPQATDGKAPLGGTVSGKDSRVALVNLLRRNIPAREILAVCLKEWKRDVLPSHKFLAPQATDMDAVITLTQPQEIVEGYHHLRELGSPRKQKEIHATKS